MPAAIAPLARLRAAIAQGQISPQSADYAIQRLKQFRDTEEGARTSPVPFAPRRQFEPHEAPGTARYQTLRSVVDGIDQELLCDGLQLRMGVDSQRPPDPPSLRDEISAAMEVHTGGRL